MAEKIINVDNSDQIQELLGNCDSNLNTIQKKYGVVIISRGNNIKIIGNDDKVNEAEQAIRALLEYAGKGENINEQAVRYVTNMVADGAEQELKSLVADSICLTTSGKVVRPKTVGQQKYVDAIKNNTIVIGIGPAGTGKTYLAVAMAVRAFKAHEITKIILTRPAVEAGESLGFLPGDLQEKVDPYLRPLYDGLFDMLGAESFQKHMERGTIEVAPLAYMRGRTLDDAFIILDEAQNTTSEQIKMFLTRLGNNSKMVITGDVTQIDLPSSKKSGLVEVTKVLKNVEDISIQRFSDKDVVRHKLVQDIIKAYEKYFDEGKKK
ncbi:MAG: PhoH family protein [Ruminococcus sp.]|nr:PhoH family protein [Ruminococcus sp.]MBP1564210.1 PhoH family protein [Oscillospiraceae bacterium]MBR6598946.1 PhoH family protein [Oscillospiraceae bacterium]